ncbi:hypothetical protein [Pseudaquabacterium pictum]|uniref:Uncharacterized protein n=1 Tax=Pseudaquabacterium pictum TaxID=2315236 RepID=A0A480AW78_9BURK|nr:hypothetical protein [Rubrivivax pictus]GCL65146.1 hypothetical protein AQPW35_42270 [Rubrivivax pictus]
MTNDDHSPSDDPIAGAFPVPFTADELRADAQSVLLLLTRQLHFIFGRSDRPHLAEQASLLGVQGDADINDPDMTPSALGLRYEHVKTTHLAETMEELYSYAFHGLQDLASADMDSESAAAWCSVVVHDLANSAFVREWGSYRPAGEVEGAVARFMLVCETAQARRILEGHDDNFMDWASPTQHGGLTMRQMALLSGMTEASVRTLSNPKRRNALVTVNDGKNVMVEIGAAKTWLQAKGRYLPIRRTNRDGQIDLAAKRFNDTDDLRWALDQRLQYLLGQDAAAKVRHQLDAIDPQLVDGGDAARPTLRLTAALMADAQAMAGIGVALNLPGELLALRAAEAHARDVLAGLEQQLQRHIKAAATAP